MIFKSAATQLHVQTSFSFNFWCSFKKVELGLEGSNFVVAIWFMRTYPR